MNPTRSASRMSRLQKVNATSEYVAFIAEWGARPKHDKVVLSCYPRALASAMDHLCDLLDMDEEIFSRDDTSLALEKVLQILNPESILTIGTVWVSCSRSQS